MLSEMSEVKLQIIKALEHPEAQEGLYFRNFYALHEEDEREAVEADQVVILDALKELMSEGKVVMEEGGKEAVFHLAKR